MNIQTHLTSYVYEKYEPKCVSVLFLPKNESDFNNFTYTFKMNFIHLDVKEQKVPKN